MRQRKPGLGVLRLPAQHLAQLDSRRFDSPHTRPCARQRKPRGNMRRIQRKRALQGLDCLSRMQLRFERFGEVVPGGCGCRLQFAGALEMRNGFADVSGLIKSNTKSDMEISVVAPRRKRAPEILD